MEIPVFENKKDLFAYLATNKDKLIATKKATIKHGASVPFVICGKRLKKDLIQVVMKYYR